MRRQNLLIPSSFLSLAVFFSSILQESQEHFVKAQLLTALYSVRSDRLFCDQLDTDLLFRWFLNMDLDTPSIDPSTFSQRGSPRGMCFD